MIRDPFDIHRKNVFKATALRTAEHVRDTVVQAGVDALDMSFSIPKHVPNFADPHRANEDRAWAGISSRDGPRGGGLMGGMQDRVSGLFEKKSLPMYKDKPYNFVPASRRRPLWKQKRILGPASLAAVFLLYLMGFFSSSSKSTSTSGWQWRAANQEKGTADWDKRRESVVEAFQLSWDTYAEHGWGTCRLYLTTADAQSFVLTQFTHRLR